MLWADGAGLPGVYDGGFGIVPVMSGKPTRRTHR